MTNTTTRMPRASSTDQASGSVKSTVWIVLTAWIMVWPNGIAVDRPDGVDYGVDVWCVS